MAKTTNKRGTSLATPMLGKTYPKGSTIKKNKNGTISIVTPKKSTKKGK